jgi:hypothetical protein
MKHREKCLLEASRNASYKDQTGNFFITLHFFVLSSTWNTNMMLEVKLSFNHKNESLRKTCLSHHLSARSFPPGAMLFEAKRSLTCVGLLFLDLQLFASKHIYK